MTERRSFEDTKENPNFDPVPAGTYLVEISGSKTKPTNAGDGEILTLNITIVSGEYEGRVIFERLNISNPNKTAEDIAWGKIKSLCMAIGLDDFPYIEERGIVRLDSDQFHQIPFSAEVYIRPAKGEYDASNSIRKYLKYEHPVTSVHQPASYAHSKPMGQRTMQKPAQPKQSLAQQLDDDVPF